MYYRRLQNLFNSIRSILSENFLFFFSFIKDFCKVFNLNFKLHTRERIETVAHVGILTITVCSFLPFIFLGFSGRDETMQPAKPSFLEYFEQKEKENQINTFGKNVSGSLKNSSDWKIPQDGDYEFVSSWS